MADTPEKRVKRRVTDQLKMMENCYYFFPATGGYGASGVPDIVGCYKGKFFAFECKANGNRPTALQEINLAKIRSAEGAALVVNEDNASLVRTYLESLTDVQS